MFVAFLLQYTNIIPFGVMSRVHIFNWPISNEPTKTVGVKTEYTPKAVVRLVSIINCFAYDRTVKDE
jgi:hypothetical protein